MIQNITDRIEFILACFPLRRRVIILQALLEAAELRVTAQRDGLEGKWRDEVRGRLNLS